MRALPARAWRRPFANDKLPAMDQTPPLEPTAVITAQPFAMRLAAALIAAFVLIVVLAFVDRAGRSQLETSEDRGPVARQR